MNRFVYESSGQEISYKNWRAGQPSNYSNYAGVEDCVDANKWEKEKGKWNDDECVEEVAFICEN